MKALGEDKLNTAERFVVSLLLQSIGTIPDYKLKPCTAHSD
ncbi:hypothetical protein QT971_28935 [Microcoleus sp. herbarium19]